MLVAAADSQGCVHAPGGLDIAALIDLKRAGRSVAEHPSGETGPPEAVIDVDCDIWIPAARPDVIRADNVGRLKARLVLEGANIPVTADAEAELHRRGVLVVPDFIANAGGVICGAVEYAGGSQTQAFQTIAEKVTANVRAVLERARAEGTPPRAAADALARERVVAASRLARWG